MLWSHTVLQVFTPIYRGVKYERCKCQFIQKESLLKLDLSPLILYLIKLLSYKWSISNPFQLRGNMDAGLVVHESCYSCLVAETKNRVVEKVVVQFVQSTFVNALCILATRCFQTRTCDLHVIFYHFYMTFAPKYNT